MQRKIEFYNALKGKRQGNLLIRDYVRTEKRKGKIWECVCDCGRTVYLTTSNLVSGHATMCPECSREKNRERSRVQLTKHGGAKTRLFSLWIAMLSRCKYTGDTDYIYYGGRGIGVCKEWENSFVAFKEWAENNGYKDGLTIDRIDGNKGYLVENCRWVPMAVQNINKETAHLVTVNGITMCITHWAKAIGVSHSTLCRVKDAEAYIKKHFPKTFIGYEVEIKGKNVFIWAEQEAG